MDEQVCSKESLADRRHRHLLYCLYMYTPPLTLPDIADQPTVWEYSGRGDDYFQERLDIYDSLYYDHLPVLQSADIVTYEQGNDIVRLGPTAEEYRSLIETEFKTEIAGLVKGERQTFESLTQ
ncbi:DUF7344 domain-containing protein (plasmid) [Haloarcula salina]|uniref:DUF7344 domain-containing protein n=1 Tax=Haloarcula salina TaxID=1429914 RepID=UPI003C6F37CD